MTALYNTRPGFLCAALLGGAWWCLLVHGGAWCLVVLGGSGAWLKLADLISTDVLLLPPRGGEHKNVSIC